MDTTVVARRRDAASLPVRLRLPTWAAVIGSRLIVLAAGSAGALLYGRATGWRQFIPYRPIPSYGSVGNVLAASLVRWDSLHYLHIAQHGYTRAADTCFFPLYPLLIHAVTWVVGSDVVAGSLISAIAFGVGLTMLHRIVSEELGPRVARVTVLLLAVAPLSLFFTAVYTESLFMALVVGTFYLARADRFGAACLAAAAASLTHVEGVLLIAPLLIMYRRHAGGRSREIWSPRAVLPLTLPLLSLAGFLVYLRTQGYGWLAPLKNANLVNYDREMMTTPVLIWRACEAAVTGLWKTLGGVAPISPTVGAPFSVGFQNDIYLMVLAISLASLVIAWRRLPQEFAVFAALALLACTWSGVPNRPLESIDRYMLPIFPLWIAAAAWLEEHRLVKPVLMVSTAAMVFYTVEFSRWVFIA